METPVTYYILKSKTGCDMLVTEERWPSGLRRRSRKAVYPLGIVGSNPTLSAISDINVPGTENGGTTATDSPTLSFSFSTLFIPQGSPAHHIVI